MDLGGRYWLEQWRSHLIHRPSQKHPHSFGVSERPLAGASGPAAFRPETYRSALRRVASIDGIGMGKDGGQPNGSFRFDTPIAGGTHHLPSE